MELRRGSLDKKKDKITDKVSTPMQDTTDDQYAEEEEKQEDNDDIIRTRKSKNKEIKKADRKRHNKFWVQYSAMLQQGERSKSRHG